MKTADLEGPKLDQWVARADGLTLKGRWWCRDGNEWCTVEHFDPSSRWVVAGSIIERACISLVCWQTDKWAAYIGEQRPYLDVAPDWDEDGSGKTALIAAMRAYVANKFGDEVPDALDGEAGASPA